MVSCKPPLLQESVWDTPELVGQAKQQLGELEDKSLPDLVHVKGCLFFCVCVCVEERWYLHQLVLVNNCWIYYLTQTFDLSMGYRQIKSEPTMFVMLSYSWIFLEHTPLYLLV